MNSAKSTRRALTSSLIALVLCLTMLMGTTFAWFTDTANVSVNTITSGNLKIKLVDADDGKTAVSDLKFENSKGETNILWEPGATFNTNAFKVVNDGSLALKFKVVVTGIEGDTGLLKVIDFKLVGPEGVKDEVSLGVGETSGAYYISGTMDTAANNDYQGLELTGISITVYATQDTVEYDSTTDDYDEKAEYEIPKLITNDELLTEAIEKHKDYTVSDGEFSKTVVADAYNVVIEGGTFKNQVIAARNGGKVTVKNAKAGSVESGGGPNILANITGGATVIIEGGSYMTNTVLTGDGTGSVVIAGGYFDCGSLYITFYGKPVKDLTITGGTFSSMMVMGQGMMGPNISDFVPDTHQIVDNADGSITVVAK